MFKINDILKKRREGGSSDVIVSLIFLPIFAFFLLALIDLGLYFQTRTIVQNNVRDAARQVALWGGNDSRLDPSIQGSRGDQANTVSVRMSRTLANNPSTRLNFDNSTPITCTPDETRSMNEVVTCQTNGIQYRLISPGNPFTLFLKGDIVIVENAVSEVKAR